MSKFSDNIVDVEPDRNGEMAVPKHRPGLALLRNYGVTVTAGAFIGAVAGFGIARMAVGHGPVSSDPLEITLFVATTLLGAGAAACTAVLGSDALNELRYRRELSMLNAASALYQSTEAARDFRDTYIDGVAEPIPDMKTNSAAGAQLPPSIRRLSGSPKIGRG
jgi:hypothetical protein